MKWIAATSVAMLLTVVSAVAQLALQQATITGYQHEGCVKKGADVTVLGAGFGNAQGLRRVVLWGGGDSVSLMVTAWFESQITVRLPADARIAVGGVYHIGLQDRVGNWVSNIGPVVTICAAQPPAPAPDLAAKARSLADAVVRASGGDNWPRVKSIRFTFNVSASTNLLVSAKHDWDVWTAEDTVSWSGKTVKVNVLNPGSDADAKAAYARWVNDSYWLLAPLKLKDAGVTLTYTGSKDGFEVLHLSFAKVGLTPGDQYNLYIDPGTSLVRRWDYTPSPGKQMTGTWDGYKEFDGLKLSTEHKFGDKRIWFSDVNVESSR